MYLHSLITTHICMCVHTCTRTPKPTETSTRTLPGGKTATYISEGIALPLKIAIFACHSWDVSNLECLQRCRWNLPCPLPVGHNQNPPCACSFFDFAQKTFQGFLWSLLLTSIPVARRFAKVLARALDFKGKNKWCAASKMMIKQSDDIELKIYYSPYWWTIF